MKATSSSLTIGFCLLSIVAWLPNIASGQTTGFTYQGKLTDTGLPGNGLYDFQFKLFDAVSGGAQQGGPVSVNAVQVTTGIFTAQIDFGACPTCFNGAARFLEIGVRLNGSLTFITLNPRQQVTANPYAIRSLNSATADGLSITCVGCISSNQIQSIQGSQVTGNIAGSQISGLIPVASVPAGSVNYIQNGESQQPSSNFHISGNGIVDGFLLADIINAVSQYNLGGSRILSNAGTRNLIAGATAGSSNFGSFNAFFGYAAGQGNTTGNNNSFIGESAGFNNRTGSYNTFIGFRADFQLLSSGGDNNTLVGALASVPAGVSNSTALGSGAQATSSHTVVLGTDQEVVIVPGKLEIDTLGTAGSQQLCLNASNRIAPCSSSLRYKTDLRPFSGGLSLINRLQPISFTWKDGGMRDLGLAAEDVAKIEPLLIVRNARGEIEGVKYDRINMALINAMKEQQSQIEEQRERIGNLEHQLEGFKRLVCKDHPKGDACKMMR